MNLNRSLLTFISSFLKICKKILRYIYRWLNNIDLAINSGFDNSFHHRSVAKTASRYDMSKGIDEKYYSHFYGNFIEENLRSLLPTTTLKILDLGCGQGRICRELSSRDIQVKSYLGVDFSNTAIEIAKSFDLQFPKDATKFVCADLDAFLHTNCKDKFNLILALEVLYMVPEPLEILRQAKELLDDEGIIILSTRTDFYMVTSLLCQGLTHNIDMVLRSDSGMVFDSGVKFHWTDLDKLSKQFLEELSLEVIDATALGIASGITGDPFENIARPAILSDDDRNKLFEAEKKLGRKYPNGGRYLIVALRKAKN